MTPMSTMINSGLPVLGTMAVTIEADDEILEELSDDIEDLPTFNHAPGMHLITLSNHMIVI